MIRVERPDSSAPPHLTSAAAREARLNRLALKKNEAPSFDAYGHTDVKTRLNVIFGRKCAYCESLLAGTQPGDVEHYRPKGKVVIHAPYGPVPPPKLGYHWLAAKWSNLLISCADCNRPRTQTDFDEVNRVIGKSNYFPLASESTRATSPRGLSREEPLLLNPCIDDPEKHLVFLDDGQIQPVSEQGTESERGRATIHYCGLARSELLQMRARHRRIVMASIRHIVAAIEANNDPGADLDDLIAMLDPKEAYVGFTLMLIRTHMGEYLESLGLDSPMQ